ncbi:unnamed protein product [Diatraea saccharalis]|uniref:Kinesin motor domain-containing protein n=1 Tax=Diatraea saccharalis TaxID=40085 RepID=A0A9N9R978_9NEOP|nr:unnamed protein product [Diatraea saccharalis]
MSDNIKVVVKVRPLISRELEEKLSYQWRVKNNTLCQLDQNGRDFGPSFTFDKVYDKDTKTTHIYNDIAKPIVEAATAGFNGTIFAYGQTSSGKTYTMTGTEDSPGIIPLAVFNLFENIKNIPNRDFLVRVSYIEIYNETLMDLLNVEKKISKVHETLQGVKVDCTEQVTTSPEEVLKYLKEGQANRQTGATNMNEESSRSHSIFQITIESREHIEGEEEVGCVNVSTLNLVDLAGSERAGQTGATGIRFKEGTHINKSLSTLALVIKQLSEEQTKLTRILQNSLGGNAKTSIICAITPAAVEETISTLQFANRAKAIKNKPEVNAVATDATMIQSLTKQLSKLQSQLESKKNLEVMLESKKNVEQDNYNLQKQIAALQRLILNGFGTRSSLDMLGSRRKLVPPRRITISTLHPIEEDQAPTLPKFHTPLLKYNPMLLSNTTDFVPIQNTKKLTRVSEENDNKLVTPPPTNKKVNFNEEIIELDSDDDNNPMDVQTCSPYHKCYGASKTPPCVLRKNAKLAEKNLKDIVELTEREKIYTPSVVELIEKLEQNASVITSLQDEVNSLHKKSKDKDLEIDQLRVKVSKSNEEIKTVSTTKAELEALCKEYTTKLTDWEVTYETLRDKAARREEELLSLLEEQKLITVHRQDHDISRPLPKSVEKELCFMDMSKDISLVNSDNENSIVNTNDDESCSQLQDLVTDMQNQLRSKNEVVAQLEADLISHQQTISSLENSIRHLQSTVDTFNERVTLLENENSLLQSTITTLNSTITSQKSSLESAHNDIESYNSVIQELQIKLTNKEKILNLNINEDTIENMIAIEEKFIANHDNMKNIIHCFKVALDSRNKEIESFKLTLTNLSCIETDLKDQLTVKDKENHNLNNKLKSLEEQININIALIEKLTQDKSNLTNMEHQLTCQISDINEQNNKLEKINNDIKLNLISIEECNRKLTATVAEKDILIEMLTKKNEELSDTLEKVNLNVNNLKNDINSLNKEEQNKKVKAILHSIHNSLVRLDCQYKDSTDYSKEHEADVFSILENKWMTFESKVFEELSSKEFTIQNYLKLNRDLELSNSKVMNELSDLRTKMLQITEDLERHKNIIEDMTEQHRQINHQLEIKCYEYDNLNSILNYTKENNQKLSNDILEIQTSKNLQIQQNDSALDLKAKIIEEKDNQIYELTQSLKTIKKDLEYKVNNISKKLNESEENERLQLNYVFEQTSILAGLLNIESNIACNDDLISYSSIVQRLEDITHNIKKIKYKKHEENLEDCLSQARKEIEHLTRENESLLEKLTKTENTNNILCLELDEIKLHNKSLNIDLTEVNKTLELLRIDLKEKSTDMEIMVTKTEDLKKHFTGLDHIMQDEIKELMACNENLKMKCSKLESVRNFTENSKSFNDDIYDINSQTITLSQCDVASQINVIENKSPPSLLTICCNTILDTIQPSENSISTSNSCMSVPFKEQGTKTCTCGQIFSELKQAQTENNKLSQIIQEQESHIKYLIQEQEIVRQEVQLLLEPAYELQKKINSHKTNLSTLTATTYAENKSLKSQVTALQHHHNRFHSVCQRDLPIVKKQLYELMAILKSDNSYIDKNSSFKRFSLPSVFDNNSTLNNLKNESTLDGDLLMLDTNVTLATSTDTLLGIDQTCLDITHINATNDVACQTIESTNAGISTEDYNLSLIDKLSDENRIIMERIYILEQEKEALNTQIQQYSSLSVPKANVQTSPIKTDNILNECTKCYDNIEKQKSLEEKLEILSQDLNITKSLKRDFEEKYNSLSLEIPSTEGLIRKLNAFERDVKNKSEEIQKLSISINVKHTEIKQLQQENESLSTQLMEVITESDELSKELECVKEENTKLTEKCSQVEILLKGDGNSDCVQCTIKNQVIKTLQNIDSHSKLNRSFSDSETSSRYNKICTLQHELHAGREDCKELTKEVATIKSQLERSNDLSIGQNMDLDDSVAVSNNYSKQHESDDPPLNKLIVSNQQEHECDPYTLDKTDCINYYIEKTGSSKDNLNFNIKMIDIMKMFYEYFMTERNKVENFINKIKCYEESKNQLEKNVEDITREYSKIKVLLEEKENNFKEVINVMSQIKKNITLIADEMSNNIENKNSKLVTIFKEKLLVILDNQFNLSSATVFDKIIESVVTKHHNDLSSITEQYTKLQKHMERLSLELNTVNDNLCQMKCQLSAKENEYNILKAQKERIYEISNAVTLDIIKKEKELCEIIAIGCNKLVDHKIISSNIDTTLPLNKIVDLLFEMIIMDYKPTSSEAEKDKENLVLELSKYKTELEGIKKTLNDLETDNYKLKEVNKSVSLNLVNVETELQSLKSSNEDIKRMYESKVKENEANILKLNQITQDLKLMKESLTEKENVISKLKTEKEMEIIGIMNKTINLKQEIDDLKTINAVISREKESYASELEKCKETIKVNNKELDNMTSDILVLRESVKENSFVIDNLKLEAKSLLQQNLELKAELDGKCKDCSRLEMNIKTHEKTAEIQSKMIIRLQKQKGDDDNTISDKNKHIEELTQRYANLQKECEVLKNNIVESRKEIDNLKNTKENLEMRVSEMEMDLANINKPRASLEPDSTRRRRQSIHDSKRTIVEDSGDHNKIEAVFESRTKPTDFFMDVDEDSSNRSTPHRSSRGRDSFTSRHEPEEKDDDPPSRPSSVAATRRRRQSTHDLHRAGVQRTPTPHERPASRELNSTDLKISDIDNNNIQSEVIQLRDQLSSCQQELEELKERFREVDEECEICSQYLREREEQCKQLKKEKATLTNIISELQEKLQSVNTNRNQQERKRVYADASVNTDEDWANLHSVVVDRMSYDAEVEKNKRLTKTIEELRYKKQDLKNILAKMQKTLEKNAARDHTKELEATKSELRICKQELKELREKYKALDVQYDKCAQYLRERDEHCRNLKEAKGALEAKLQEYQENSGNIAVSVRKKRQSAYDQNRCPNADVTDACTETTDDFLSYQVEHDGDTNELRRLKSAVDKLSQQKAALEHQLISQTSASAPNPVYIATGSAIVQNQQITDVMKENQKLKKVNAKLIQICKKRGKKYDMENQDVSEQA